MAYLAMWCKTHFTCYCPVQNAPCVRDSSAPAKVSKLPPKPRSAEKMVRFGLSLSEELHEKVVAQAAREGIKRAAFIRDCLRIATQDVKVHTIPEAARQARVTKRGDDDPVTKRLRRAKSQ